MAIIRHVEVKHFRAIQSLSWYPSPGINCLIGSGDSGKSSLLDALDFCIGARRTIQIDDSDFHMLDHTTPIEIRVTIGALDDALKNIDTYGLYLRGYDDIAGEITPEPGADLESVLTIQLVVESDLEPEWSLVSERAAAQGLTRNLTWADRGRIAPTRLGAYSDNHMSWSRGSILYKLSDERADASQELAAAARELRTNFGEKAKKQLAQSLDSVKRAAVELGVPIGTEAKAMLNVSSLSLGGGTIALHDEKGIPLRALGLGSARLLIAGLQREVAEQTSILLVDELEYGLEPHRIIGFLHALGAKETNCPVQVFMTTHSPVAVRELSVSQLFVLRNHGHSHQAYRAELAGDVQGTIRKYPEAMLAKRVLVCEGASEVGMVRGLDQYRSAQGQRSIASDGTGLIDGGGDEMFVRARAFQAMGYETAVLRDSDKLPTPELEAALIKEGGSVFCWRDSRALEDELFCSLSDAGVEKLLDLAVELKDESLVDQHIRSASKEAQSLNAIKAERAFNGIYQPASRALLGKAAKSKDSRKSWFKSVSAMEAAGLEIIGPELDKSDADFQAVLRNLFSWIHHGGL